MPTVNSIHHTKPVRVSSGQLDFVLSRHSYVYPFPHWTAANRAILHPGRAVAASALVAAWHREVRLGVGEANDARRLASDGRLGRLRPASTELRVGERRHGG